VDSIYQAQEILYQTLPNTEESRVTETPSSPSSSPPKNDPNVYHTLRGDDTVKIISDTKDQFQAPITMSGSGENNDVYETIDGAPFRVSTQIKSSNDTNLYAKLPIKGEEEKTSDNSDYQTLD